MPKGKKKVRTLLHRMKNLPLLQLPEYHFFLRRMEEVEKEITDKEFRITVAGEFSAGKSTFINAIIGADLLPHALSETTATVTYIQNVKSGDPKKNTIEVSFYDKRPLIILPFNKEPGVLKDFVTAMSAQYRVVDEIEMVNVYIDFPYTNERVTIIDTPGLNGMAEGHKERTIHEIHRSHASIILLPLRGLSQSSTEFSLLIQKYQNHATFILNFADLFNENEGETLEERVQLLHDSLLKQGISSTSILAVSSLKALVARDTSIPRLYHDSLTDVTMEEREILWKESNFAMFEEHLWNELVGNMREKIMEQAYEKIVNGILVQIEDEGKILHELMKVSLEQGEKALLQQRIMTFEKNRDKYLELVLSFLRSRHIETEEAFIDYANEKLTALEERMRKVIINADGASFGRALEEGTYQQTIHEEMIFFKEHLMEALSIHLQDIYQGALLQVTKYYPSMTIKGNDDDNHSFQYNLGQEEFQMTGLEQNIEKQQNKLNALMENYERVEKEEGRLRATIEDHSSEIQWAEKKIHNLQNEFQQRRRSLGSKPQPIESYENYTEDVRFLMFFTRKETVQRLVEDDSNVKHWFREKEKVEQEYGQEIDKISRELRLLRQRKQRFQEKQIVSKRQIEQLERQVVNREEALKDEIESKNYQMELRKKEYYSRQKKLFLNKLAETVEIDWKVQFHGGIRESLTSNMVAMEEKVSSHYKAIAQGHQDKLFVLLGEQSKTDEQRKVKMIEETMEEINVLRKSHQRNREEIRK